MLSIATFAGAARYEYQEGHVLYYAAEGERLIRVIEVGIRETSNPFNDWGFLLVEPCKDPTSRENELPCWPDEKQQRSQHLLRRIQAELPDYRTRWGLLRAAQYVNRDLGAFHPAWVVGTDPLVVAFRRGTGDPHPYKDLKLYHGSTTRPTTTPGLIEIVSRSGRTRLYDLRARHAKLVSESELKVEADVVLVFPKGIRLPSGQSTSETTTQPAPSLKVFHLREPATLETIMQRLTESGALERSADRVEEVAVKPT